MTILERAMSLQVGEELMRQLRESYPNVLPIDEVTEVEFNYRRGQQDVIRWLQRKKVSLEQGHNLEEPTYNEIVIKNHEPDTS